MISIDLMNFTGLITVMGAFVLTLAQAWVMIQNTRIKAMTTAAQIALAKTNEKLEIVHGLVNGQSEKLNRALENAAREEGKKVGRIEERAYPLQPKPAQPVAIQMADPVVAAVEQNTKETVKATQVVADAILGHPGTPSHK